MFKIIHELTVFSQSAVNT